MVLVQPRNGLVLLQTLFFIFYIGLTATALLSWFLLSHGTVHSVTQQFAQTERGLGVYSKLLSCWKGNGPYCSADTCDGNGAYPNPSCTFNALLGAGDCYTVTVTRSGGSYQMNIVVPDYPQPCP